jgi:uronate dehydrogenase
VRRIVYASSVHAVMGYPVDHQAHAGGPPRPDTMYGVTKLFGEGLCSSFAYEHGMSCIAIRIGAYVADKDRQKVVESDNPQLLDIVISERDMAALIHKSIIAPDAVDYAIVNGLSDNRFKRMDLESTKALLGYEPEDDAFEWSEKVDFGAEEKV